MTNSILTMSFNKKKRAEIVRFGFMIYMLILGVAFGLFLFQGYSLLVEADSIDLQQHLQLAVFAAESAFTLDKNPVTLSASIALHEEVTSVELRESNIVAYIGASPFFRSIKTYPTSTVQVGELEDTNTIIFSGFDNTLILGNNKKSCLPFRPPIYIIQRDSHDLQFANIVSYKDISVNAVSISHDFMNEPQIVFDIDISSSGLTIYSNQDPNQLCSFTQYLDSYNINYAVVPLDDYTKIRNEFVTDQMTYVVGGENIAQLAVALEEFVE